MNNNGNNKELADNKKENYKEKAYRIIKDKIIKCQVGPGDILDEKRLVEEIGASRTPIREALNKIEQENLIRIIPKRGIFVSEITPKDVNDLFQVREEIDPFTTRIATPLLPESELLKFRELFTNLEKLPDMEVFDIDNRFHSFIIAECNNRYLSQMMDSIYAQNQRIRVLSAKLNNRLNTSKYEHLSIIAHLLDRDADGAAEEMKKHVISSREASYKFLMTFK